MQTCQNFLLQGMRFKHDESISISLHVRCLRETWLTNKGLPEKLPLETESVKERRLLKRMKKAKRNIVHQKAMSKKERLGLMKFLQCLDPKILGSEM